MIGVKFSNSYNAKMLRIKRLPEYVPDMMIGALKKDAVGIVKTFHDGIKNDTLELEFLKPATIQQKDRKGFENPDSPLYGKGDDAKDRSYSNMLRIRKLKNGWKVYPSRAMHWSGKITLNHLFQIHEYGCTVTARNGNTFRIPPRPAFMYSYRKWMNDKKKNQMETSVTVKKAITDYINNAETQYIKKLTDINKKKEKFEE